MSDHYIQEASFVKIDNISIGYNMTTNSGCKIRFFGSLQNVATFTDYEGIDPEIMKRFDLHDLIRQFSSLALVDCNTVVSQISGGN